MSYNPEHILQVIRETLLPLPGTREGICFGATAFYIQKKLLCTLKLDDATMYLYHHDRDELIAINPDIYFTTDHYKNWPSVLINLPLISDAALKALLINAWKLKASKTQLKVFEAMPDKLAQSAP
jgi:hypothetical protein